MVSATFNVADMSPYLEDKTLVNLRPKSSQQREDAGDEATTNQVTPIIQ